MFKHTSRFETIMRISLMFVLLLSACGPAQNKPKPETTSPVGSKAKVPASAPTATPVKFIPPALAVPTRTSPQADTAPVSLPPQQHKDTLEIAMTPTPAVVALNGLVKLTVDVHNYSSQLYSGLTYSDTLEKGLAYIPNPLSKVAYDDQSQEISYTIDSLPAGQEITFSYSVKVTEFNQNDHNGEVWLHRGELTNAGNVDLSAHAAFVVGMAGLAPDASIAAVQPQGGWYSAGAVSVFMPKNTFKQDGVLIAAPKANTTGKGPAIEYSLSVVNTGVLAEDQSGNIAEQRTPVKNTASSQFNSPVTLQINLDKVGDLRNIPAGQEPYVATYDETNKIWVKVPIQTVDAADNDVTVETTHFSTWGAGLGSSMPQNGTEALLFSEPYTSLFTGAAEYSIPIWTPTALPGMTPNISLSYSSSTVDGVLGDVQAPWVGMGWNIDGTEIVRKITTDDNGYGYENSFALTLNGAEYDLTQDTNHPSRYYVQQNGFLYIVRHNYSLGNEADALNNVPVGNPTGEWWEVVTTDGTRYRLGWNPDSQQLAPMYGYSCTGGSSCLSPDGVYASIGYAGTATNLVTRRWRVDLVTDAHNNFIQYAYQKYQPPSSSNVLAYDRESYLKSISYGGTPGSPAYQVIFALGDRSTIGDVPNLYNVWDYIDTKYLQSIQINCLICTFGSGGNPVRTYQMNYSLAQAPNANGSLTLTSITISGGGFTEGGISVPQASTATVNFTYTNLPNRAPHGTNEQFNYPRLTQIDNGYGGKLTYTYETDGRDYTSWYNYRVLNAQVDSGMGLAAYQKYTYPMSPAYVGAGTNPNAGGLIGYPTVIESVLDYNNGNTSLLDTTHTFGTTGLDIGRELSTVLTSGGTALEKTINTYITDNSQAPFPGWNYRYLARTDSFVGNAGILTLTSSTTYQNDPATGNLLVQSDYLGSTLYRSTYYEYLVNSAPSVYILSTVSRKVVTDANNIVSSDVHYDYDSTINTPPTKGDLTLIQTLTGNGNQTVDASFGYDNYGNQTSAILYNVNGTLGTAPSASNSYAMTTTNFDTTKSTYRVSQSDPLGETTTTDYLYSLGMPYQVTDANNWTTKTTYDGLGRTLSTQAPGLNQAGVLYTYPTPNSSNKVGAPYAIQMQILDVPAGVYRSVFGMYDGLGRIIQNQIYDADQGQVLLTETAFNAQGKPSRQSQPHYASMSAGWYLAPNWANLNYTASEFDGLGRTTKVTTPGNLVTRTSYSGLTTTVMDPNGNLQSSTSDGLGRQVQLQEYNGTTLYATTQYAYDIANRLIQTKDAQGNVTTLTYNQLGQKIGMSDPDMGNWSYQYDVAGNLSQQTDANGQTLAFTYDKLNRLTQKVQKIANQNDAVLATYAYGDSAGQYGMRVAMTDQSSSPSNTWIYSNFGRTVLQKQIIGGVEKDFTTNSDWLGRPLTATNPDGETISYSYDALGRAKNFSSSAYASTTLASLAYNALSQITSEALGNGANISNAYDATTGRLTSRQANTNATVTPTATPLMNFSYSYDNNGNITQIQDGTLNENATYTYDGLNRLTHANSTNTSTLASIYNQNYTYDKLGDILWVGPGSQAAVIGQGSDMAFSLLPGANAASAELAALQLKPYLDDSTTATATPLATSTPTNIPSNTPFPTPTSTFTLTPSFTPTLNGSQTNTPTSSKTLTPSNSPTRTNTPTITKTPTQVTYTATKTPTPTFTSTPTTGLMGYWSFDDINGTTVPDDTGRGNAGTLSSGAQSFSPGESGTAMHFDGSTNGYVKIPYDSDLAPAGSFLVSAWVNPDSITIGRNTRMLDRDGVFQLGFNTNGYLQFQISGLTPAQVVGPQLPLNQWTLVTASYDSSAKQMSLYVNGILVAAVVATSGTPATNGNSFYLGSSNLSERYRGFLDEVRFYNVLPATPTPTITLVATNTGTQVSSATLIPTLTPTFTPSLTSSATSTNVPVTPTPVKVNTFSVLNVSSATNSSGSLTWNHTTVAGDNSLLLVGIGVYPSSASVSSVQYNGLNLIRLKARMGAELWYLLNPPVGTYPIQVTTTGSSLAAGGLTISGVNQADPFGSVAVSDGNGASSSVNISSNTGEMVVDLLALFSTSWTPGSGSGQTRLWRLTNNNPNSGMSTKPGANGTVNTSWSWSGSLSWAMAAVSLRPATIGTRTATPTLTATPTSQSYWGTGTDGDVVLGTAATPTPVTYNLSTQSLTGRSCADGGDAVAYSVTQLTAGYADLELSPSAGCLSAGDEILLINLQGSSVSTVNVGNYEFLRVAGLSSNRVYFASPKNHSYGENPYDDTNIGTNSGQQNVIIQRVPNYHNMTINANTTLTANAWNGKTGGILAFRVAGTLSGSGTILADHLGYAGGSGGASNNGCGSQGESYGGTGGGCDNSPNLGGGGSGATAGGGGYGSAGSGEYNRGDGGNIYGSPDLGSLFLGSGGGGSDGSTNSGHGGGKGGGILLIAANTINWNGTLSSNGANGDSTGHSGGGSGGSILIDANTITMGASGSLDAIAGSPGDTNRGGGIGRIAVYYVNTPSWITTSPSAAYYSLASGPTPAPTSVLQASPTPGNTGADGDLQVQATQIVNLSTGGLPASRNCADGGAGVAYSVIELGSLYARASSAPAYDCLSAGDEILLINLQGSRVSTANTGHYEFLRVSSVKADIVYFASPKSLFYGENPYDDTNIGTNSGQQNVIIQRVPNYNNVTIDGTLTANAWGGKTGGVLAFRVAGTLSGSGTILADHLGYAGGSGGTSNGGCGSQGESYGGTGGGCNNSPNLGGGGSGETAGGGGYGSRGATNSTGGNIYGNPDLGSLFLGSGGGGSDGATGSTTNAGKNGGRGGGIVLIAANAINWNGALSSDGANGTDGAGHSGGGSGGSILIDANTITVGASGSLGANAGSPGDTNRGGGIGRSAVYYQTSFSAPTGFTPNYLVHGQCQPDAIFLDSFESGNLNRWAGTPATDGGKLSTNPAAAYWGRYGLQAFISVSDKNDQYVQDTSPSSEVHYRARFYFDPAVSMASSDTIDIFDGYSNAISGTPVFKVQLSKSSGTYQVRALAWNGSNYATGGITPTPTGSPTPTPTASATATLTTTSTVPAMTATRTPTPTATLTTLPTSAPIASGWIAVEVEYYADAQTGRLSLWVNGALQTTLNSLNNGSYSIDTVQLGAMNMSADTGTTGTIYYDDFDSHRNSYIGLLPNPGGNPTATPTPTSTPAASYTYDPMHLHAVADVAHGGSIPDDQYKYDANGNMTCRVEGGQTYNQVYNAENRLSLVQLLNTGGSCPTADTASPSTDVTASWEFTYDGDGARVKQLYATYDASGAPTSALTTDYFAGGSYEMRSDGNLEKYYAFGGQTIAMIGCTWTTDGNGGTVDSCPGSTNPSYFLTDQLGSVVAVTDSTGALLSQQRYLPFGQVRTDVGAISQTDFGYTGQRAVPNLGLMDYNARFYDSYLNRWDQPDTIIPDGNPQSLNRFSYVGNNPINFNDPSGHCVGPLGVSLPDSSPACGINVNPPVTVSPTPTQQKSTILEDLTHPAGNQIQFNIDIGVSGDDGSNRPITIALYYSLNVVTDYNGGLQVFYTERDQEFDPTYSDSDQGAYKFGPAEKTYPSDIASLGASVLYGWIDGSDFRERGTNAFAGRAVSKGGSLLVVGGDYYEGYDEVKGRTDPSNLRGYDVGFSAGAPAGATDVATKSIPFMNMNRWQMPPILTTFCKALGMCGG